VPAHKTPSMSPESGRHATYTCGAVFTLCTLLLYLYEPTLLRYLDNRLYDMLLRSAAAGQTTGVPVIVDLDEKAFAQFGQWPWPRYRIALLLEKLRELAPATVGLDMVFAEADRTSFGTLQEEILRDLKIHVKLSGLPTALVDNDKMLAGVLSRGSFVLGYRFSFANEQPPHRDCVLHPMNLVTEMPTEVPPGAGSLFMAQDAVCNLRVLSEAAPASGFFNVAPDFDGILRRVPLLMIHDGRFYPSLSLAAFMHTFGTNQVTLKVTSRGVDSLRLRNVIIPLDARGNLLVRFRGKGRSFTYVSAGDVLTDRIPKSQIQGKIVFLGTSAAALGESRPTPVDAVFPGVEVHATIVDNILKNEFVSRPNWVPGLELFLVVAMGGLSTLLLGWTGAAWSLSVLALGALGLWQASHWALHTKGIFLSPLIPLISLAGNFSLLTLCKYWREERKARARTREIARIQDFTIL